MASQDVCDNSNMHHRIWSSMGAPHSYIPELYIDIGRQTTEQGENRIHSDRRSGEANQNEVPSILTRSREHGGARSQQLYVWEGDPEAGEPLANNFFFDQRWNHGNVSPGWESVSRKEQFWGQINDVPTAFGDEFMANKRILENSLSSIELLQTPIPYHPGIGDFNLNQHNSSGAGGRQALTENIEFANLVQRNKPYFAQTTEKFCPQYDPPFHNHLVSLEANLDNREDNILFQSPYNQHLFSPMPNISNQGQGYGLNWGQPINDRYQLYSLDDVIAGSFSLLTMQSLETPYISQDTIIPTEQMQSSHLSIGRYPSLFLRRYATENTSTIHEIAPPSSNTIQHITSHDLGITNNHQLSDSHMLGGQRTTAIESQTMVEENPFPEPKNWHHISSTQLKPHQVIAIKDAKQKRKANRRQGKLNPEAAKNAREMRLLRACLPCVIMKMRCSPGDICKRCGMLGPQSLGRGICTRARLEDFTDLLFPFSFVSHYQSQSIDQLSSETNLGFVGTDIEVALTCGSYYPPLSLVVSEFSPKSDQAVRVVTVITQSVNDPPSLEYRCSPPIANRSTYKDLLERCRNHVKFMVKKEKSLPGPILKQGHEISRLTLKAIARYCGSLSNTRTVTNLEKAMMLHAIYKFMATTLKITDLSNTLLNNYLRKPTMITYDSSIASRLLNRQIKSAMHDLREQLAREVLEELEKELKTRSKASWAPCFCVALLLCLCVEEAQISMDAFAMHTRALGAVQDAPSSQNTIECCRKLDDLLFNHLLGLFHGIYKTHQISKAHSTGRVYNPIRDGPEIDLEEGLDQNSADLVSEFRVIIANHKDEIMERAETPSFTGEYDSLATHMDFRDRNSARLVSLFLKSFSAC